MVPTPTELTGTTNKENSNRFCDTCQVAALLKLNRQLDFYWKIVCGGGSCYCCCMQIYLIVNGYGFQAMYMGSNVFPLLFKLQVLFLRMNVQTQHIFLQIKTLTTNRP